MMGFKLTRDAAVDLLGLLGACALFALSPFVCFAFVMTAGVLGCMAGAFPNTVQSLSWLRKGVVFTALISVLWYQKAQAITGLCDNAFFKLSFLTGPVPNELWISLFFAVIAGFQAALRVDASAYALPEPAQKKETLPHV
jgi:hypothetical protein